MFNMIKKLVGFVVVTQKDGQSTQTTHMYTDGVIDLLNHCPDDTLVVVYGPRGKKPIHLHYNDLDMSLN